MAGAQPENHLLAKAKLLEQVAGQLSLAPARCQVLQEARSFRLQAEKRHSVASAPHGPARTFMLYRLGDQEVIGVRPMKTATLFEAWYEARRGLQSSLEVEVWEDDVRVITLRREADAAGRRP